MARGPWPSMALTTLRQCLAVHVSTEAISMTGCIHCQKFSASGSACRLWTERSQVRAVASTHCTVCEKDLPLITSPRPRTVREATALGTSFFFRDICHYYITLMHFSILYIMTEWKGDNIIVLRKHSKMMRPWLEIYEYFVPISKSCHGWAATCFWDMEERMRSLRTAVPAMATWFKTISLIQHFFWIKGNRNWKQIK